MKMLHAVVIVFQQTKQIMGHKRAQEMYALRSFDLPNRCPNRHVLASHCQFLPPASWSRLPNIANAHAHQYAVTISDPAIKNVKSGMIAGAYQFTARDAKRHQVDATAGNPASIVSTLDCPATVIAMATLMTKTTDGVRWSLSVDDGPKPGINVPAPAFASIHAENQSISDVNIMRLISPQLANNELVAFGMHSIADGAQNTIKWLVLLNTNCSNSP